MRKYQSKADNSLDFKQRFGSGSPLVYSQEIRLLANLKSVGRVQLHSLHEISTCQNKSAKNN